MNENPFIPPASVDTSPQVSASNQYFLKPTTVISRWLVGVLVVSAITTLGIGLADVAGHLLVEGYADGDFEPAGTGLAVIVFLAGLALLSVPLFLASVVLFCVWMHRSNSNAHAFGTIGMLNTPGWSVGYWFIPIVNLFKPYQAVCEIYRASSSSKAGIPEGGSWKDIETPGYFVGWWFCWIVGNIVSRIETRANLMGNGLGEAALGLSVASTLLTVTAAVLVIRIVLNITAIQQQRMQSM